MENAIKETLDARGLKPTPFAREIGIPTSTMFSIYRGQVAFGKITIENFLKIAHGLGMTAEELYYGEQPARSYADPRQGRINEQYEGMNERGQQRAADSVDDIHSNPANLKSAEALDPEGAERRTA